MDSQVANKFFNKVNQSLDSNTNLNQKCGHSIKLLGYKDKSLDVSGRVFMDSHLKKCTYCKEKSRSMDEHLQLVEQRIPRIRPDDNHTLEEINREMIEAILKCRTSQSLSQNWMKEIRSKVSKIGQNIASNSVLRFLMLGAVVIGYTWKHFFNR